MAAFGHTDLDVFPLCLGGNVFGWTADEADSFAVLDAYAAAGGNFVDTADSYSAWAPGNRGGESEEIIGRWLSGRGNRDRIVVATKVGRMSGKNDLRADTIRQAAEDSLRRLQTDHIDLYYAHGDDNKDIPLEETLGAFDELVRAGKVRYVAASNYDAPRLAEALAISARDGLAPYVALQPHYNLVERGYEDGLQQLCADEGLACLPYFSLAKGFLTGKYRPGGAPVDSPRSEGAAMYLDERGIAVLAVLDEIAAAHHVSVAAVALAWLLAQPTVVAPIASARTPEQLAALLPMAGLELTPDDSRDSTRSDDDVPVGLGRFYAGLMTSGGKRWNTVAVPTGKPTRPRTPLVATSASRRRRRWPWLVGVVALLVVGALAAVWFAWPSGSIGVSAEGLPQLHVSRLAGDVVRVSVQSPDGTPIPVVVRGDETLVPVQRVQAGTGLVAEVVVRRPNAVGWLLGHTQTVRQELEAPTVALRTRWLRVKPGAPVRVSFDRPVREVRVTGIHPWRVIRPAQPAQVISLGRLGQAGTIGVSAVALGWERLPVPTSVTWFPPGREAMLLASPRPGGELSPVTPLQLRFSDPVARVLHGKMPTLRLPAAGRWRATDAHTLEFRPRGYGFGLDRRVAVKLPVPVRRIGGARKPTSTIVWTTPQASELRLEQLLALLQYLPLTWTADTADAPRTIAGELTAAVAPPAGKFVWRYPNTPPELVHLWRAGSYSAIVRGAVMAFQNEHHLTVDGFVGHDVWQALIADVIAGMPRPGGYSYVYVHSTVPQSLNLWHNGRVILTSPGNTGVPAAPTQLGTFEVFEHIPIGTMSGTNPDGSHYHDPGIRWISYFNHGEGIHAFNRSSFGTPQSLGCVELPLAAAATVWPYTPIGTLVSVER